jgi:hypothetical protein
MQTFVLEWESNFPMCDGDKLPRTMIVVADNEDEAVSIGMRKPINYPEHYPTGKPDVVTTIPELTGTVHGVIYDSAS